MVSAEIGPDRVVRQFAGMTALWGVVALLVGVFLDAQLTSPVFNVDIPWLSYGQLRPLYSKAVVVALGGSLLFTLSYYVAQRAAEHSSKSALFGGALPIATFWGWNLALVLAAFSLSLAAAGTEIAAVLDRSVTILCTAVWVAAAVVFFGTLFRGKTGWPGAANYLPGIAMLAVAILSILGAILPVSPAELVRGQLSATDALAMYTDWTLEASRPEVIGWLALALMSALYLLVPRIAGRDSMHSRKLVIAHLAAATLGLLLYTVALWLAGIMQGLSWRTVNADGALAYSFAESLTALQPWYLLRLVGSGVYLLGTLLLFYNVLRTLSAGPPSVKATPAP